MNLSEIPAFALVGSLLRPGLGAREVIFDRLTIATWPVAVVRSNRNVYGMGVNSCVFVKPCKDEPRSHSSLPNCTGRDPATMRDGQRGSNTPFTVGKPHSEWMLLCTCNAFWKYAALPGTD